MSESQSELDLTVSISNKPLMPAKTSEQILVIKHGALGDFVLATGPFKAIRNHHSEAHIILLTTPPLGLTAQSTGWFDEVWIDERPKVWQFTSWLRVTRRLYKQGFERVYDLQNSDRTCTYFQLWPKPRPSWSGIARGSSMPHNSPHRDKMHTLKRQAEQLALAGIHSVPLPDVSWAKTEISQFGIKGPFALMVPGSSAHRPLKRWPTNQVIKLAQHIASHQITPVLIGTEAERNVLTQVAAAVPQAINLCNKTCFKELASLSRNAKFAIGNDTGPMHLSLIHI